MLELVMTMRLVMMSASFHGCRFVPEWAARADKVRAPLLIGEDTSVAKKLIEHIADRSSLVRIPSISASRAGRSARGSAKIPPHGVAGGAKRGRQRC
jgi:hypothetical protein